MKNIAHLFARRLALTLLALFATATVRAQENLALLDNHTLTAYAENSYLITSVEDWDALAEYVASGKDCAGKTFKMTADLGTTESPVTSTMGRQNKKNDAKSRMRFAGIFDGDGHTLTVNLSSAETNPNYCAPFAYVKNVTIKNLHVAGTVTTDGQFASGLVGSSGNGESDGACTIESCQVSVEIMGKYEMFTNNKYPNHGGFIGIAEGNATITGCWFDGSFTGKNQRHSGGFIGLTKKTTVFNNCLFNPSKIDVTDNKYANAREFSNTVSGTVICNNCYYVTPFGSDINELPQGTPIQTTPSAEYEYKTVVMPDGVTYYINVVNVTVKGYGESTESDRWMFIASPVVTDLNPDEVFNLMSETVTEYDLYRFNQSGANGEWENSKNDAHQDFVLKNGQGYLYANKKDIILSFAGTFNEETSKKVNLDYDGNAVKQGWNLVGNPFPVEAYLNASYYVMNSTGTGLEAVPASSSDAIATCTGVMVQATGKNKSVTFSTTAPSQSAHEGNLQITVAQSNTRDNDVLDKVIVSFNSNDELGKYYFGEQNASLYIAQNGEEYAIASTEKQGEMPVSFKTAHNGTYTLHVNPETVSMDYLHLIDNLTGADIDLLATPSYRFNAKSDDYTSRFRLVFSAQGSNGQEENFAFVSQGEIIVESEGTVQVIDLTGRIVATCKDATRRIATDGMSSGIYTLRLINGDQVKSQKVIIK